MAKQAMRKGVKKGGGRSSKMVSQKGRAGKSGAPAPQPMISGRTRVIMLFCLMALVPFSIPTMVVLFAGLLPTLVAALTDRSKSRYAWICVGGMNFAGLAPALLKLWFGHHEITFALHQVTDFRVLLLAYASAAMGWLLYFGAPPVVITVMVATTKRRAAGLIQTMQKLEGEWGNEVASRQVQAQGDAKMQPQRATQSA